MYAENFKYQFNKYVYMQLMITVKNNHNTVVVLSVCGGPFSFALPTIMCNAYSDCTGTNQSQSFGTDLNNGLSAVL